MSEEVQGKTTTSRIVKNAGDSSPSCRGFASRTNPFCYCVSWSETGAVDYSWWFCLKVFKEVLCLLQFVVWEIVEEVY